MVFPKKICLAMAVSKYLKNNELLQMAFLNIITYAAWIA
jgi:hypothetical protein